jgi:hypothetical protein
MQIGSHLNIDRFLLVLVAIGGALLLLFLRYDPPLGISSMNESLKIPQEEILTLEAAAEAGDAQAALRLSYHYGLALHDTRKLYYYTCLAAKTGDPHSIREWNALKTTDPKLAEEIENELGKVDGSDGPSIGNDREPRNQPAP